MNFKIESIEFDFSSLKLMLDQLNSQKIAVEDPNEASKVQLTLVEWLAEKILAEVKTLDPSSVSCNVTKDILTSLACGLVLLMDDEQANKIAKYSTAYTQILEAYCLIVEYLLKRYESGCAEELQRIYTSYASNFTKDQQNITQDTQGVRFTQPPGTTKPNPEAGLNFSLILYNYTKEYLCHFLPGLIFIHKDFAEKKLLNNLHCQCTSILRLCKEITTRFSRNDIRTRILKFCIPLLKKETVDKAVTKDLWKFSLNFVARSAFDSEDFKGFIKKIISEIGDYFKSMTKDNFIGISNMLMEALIEMYRGVRTAMNIRGELGAEITDNFMDKICGTTLVLAEHTTHLCCFGLHENIEIEARNYAQLVTEMFDTLTLILKQFGKLDPKTSMVRRWTSISVFNETLVLHVKPLMDEVYGKMGRLEKIPEVNKGKGREKTTEPMKPEKVVAQIKRDEKIYVNYEKSFQKFHVELLMTDKKIGGSLEEGVQALGFNQQPKDIRTNRNFIRTLAALQNEDEEEEETAPSEPMEPEAPEEEMDTLENRNDESNQILGAYEEGEEEHTRESMGRRSSERRTLEDAEITSPEPEETDDNDENDYEARTPPQKRGKYSDYF